MEKPQQNDKAMQKLRFLQDMYIDGDIDQNDMYVLVLNIINEYGLDYTLKQFQTELLEKLSKGLEG